MRQGKLKMDGECGDDEVVGGVKVKEILQLVSLEHYRHLHCVVGVEASHGMEGLHWPNHRVQSTIGPVLPIIVGDLDCTDNGDYAHTANRSCSKAPVRGNW